MNEADVLRVNEPSVIHESIDGEVVIVNLDTGGYFGLSPSANAVWGLIDGRRSVGEVLSRIRALYAGQGGAVDEGVGRFLTSLRENALVVNGSVEGGEAESGNGSDPEAAPLPSYQPPELIAYTDMQDLLLLDPIHEVDESGWPNPKREPADEPE